MLIIGPCSSIQWLIGWERLKEDFSGVWPFSRDVFVLCVIKCSFHVETLWWWCAGAAACTKSIRRMQVTGICCLSKATCFKMIFIPIHTISEWRIFNVLSKSLDYFQAWNKMLGMISKSRSDHVWNSAPPPTTLHIYSHLPVIPITAPIACVFFL